MRTIKFRGKNANGEWVEGSLITDKYQRTDGKQFDVAFIASGLPCTEQPNDMWTAKMQRVEPATVGQFTGFYDKNGKEVYEGDILRLENTHNGFLPKVGYVSFVDGVFSFTSPQEKDGKRKYFYIWNMQYEVIGNISDNSDKLNGE